MELRIAFRWRQPVLGKDVRVIKVNRFIKAVAGRVVIHHFEILANRTGTEPFSPVFDRVFPHNLVCSLVYQRSLEPNRQTGIECIPTQPAMNRLRNGSHLLATGYWFR